MNDLTQWRMLATSFPCLSRMVLRRELPSDFTALTLIEALSGSLARIERSVCEFLLHVWNEHENAFGLAETRTWDEAHQLAFIGWVDGRTLGCPLRYF